MSFSGAAPPIHPRSAIIGTGEAWGSSVTTGGRGLGARDRVRPNGQTLRVPARVVMLGPPYPLISPMSRVRI
jgi:hypothetical protein